ncbi:uncharacterized protein IL334_005598 [Kwoniella shivajii]|uniref:BZIP domain-containing protein n=1 Tax=Kwoniella shivajii TaxID=564305 RepID=A0ABZ1D3K4_9TREE|nr:hypothetical protein IL334_005598 [Kwoniella shivajii]
MPKAAAEDHRPARAVLHAPYPLPFVITRFPAVPTDTGTSAQLPCSPAFSAPPIPSGPSSSFAQHQNNIPLPPASIAEFPTFNHDWRKSKPAFPPIPYPIASLPQTELQTQVHIQASKVENRKRIKKLQLLKLTKNGDESSEWEMFSNTTIDNLNIHNNIHNSSSNQLSKEQKELLSLTKQVGRISADGELDENDPNQDENNLLIYSFISSCNQGDFDSPASDIEPTTPTQAKPFPLPSTRTDTEQLLGPIATHEHDKQPSIPIGRPTPFPGSDGSSISTHTPCKRHGPAWDIVSSAASSFWSDGTDADQADEEDGTGTSNIRLSPLTQSLITPSASASRNRSTRERSLKKQRTHSPDPPLFFGRTHQVPFTFVPLPKAPPSQSSLGDSGILAFDDRGGYISEAGSVRTIRQIPRSKVNRMRVTEREQYIQKEKERSITPTQNDYPRQPSPRLKTATSSPVQSSSLPYGLRGSANLASNIGIPFLLPNTNHMIPQQTNLKYLSTNEGVMNGTIPQQSMFGLEPFLFSPIAPLLRTSEVLSSLTSGDGPPVADKQSSEVAYGRRESSWSPQPMSIDPRTTESQSFGNGMHQDGVSWPHALPDREQITPSNASSFSLLNKHETSSDMDVPMPTAQSRIIQSQRRQKQKHKKMSMSRTGFQNELGNIPMGKACHNFLSIRKQLAAKKRKVNNDIGKHRRVREMINEARSMKNNATTGPTNQSPPNQHHHSAQQQPQQNQPQQQQQHNQQLTLPWGFNLPYTNVDPNFQAQLFAQMMQIQMAQQQQQQYQTVPLQQQTPAQIGVPLGYYPFDQNIGFPLPSSSNPWSLNMPLQQTNQLLNQQQQQQQQQIQHPNSHHTWLTQSPNEKSRSFQPRPNAFTPQPHPQQQPSSQLFRFPTPGPTPQASNPFADHVPFTPRSPEVDVKPPRKRRRSISPSSAHDLFLHHTLAHSHPREQARSPTPKPGMSKRLLSPAEIRTPNQWRTNIKKERDIQSEINDESENEGLYDGALFDMALEKEAKHEQVNKYERRNEWVQQERTRVGSLNLGLGSGSGSRGTIVFENK